MSGGSRPAATSKTLVAAAKADGKSDDSSEPESSSSEEEEDSDDEEQQVPETVHVRVKKLDIVLKTTSSMMQVKSRAFIHLLPLLFVGTGHHHYQYAHHMGHSQKDICSSERVSSVYG